MRPQKNDDIQERAEYTYFEVVTFTTDAGKEVQSHLYGKGESESLYSVGDTVEIYYNPEAPAQITDASSHAQLIKGIAAIVFGLFIFIVITILSRKNLSLRNSRFHKCWKADRKWRQYQRWPKQAGTLRHQHHSPDLHSRQSYFLLIAICTMILYSWHRSGSKSIYSPVYNNLSLASGIKNRILNGFFFYQNSCYIKHNLLISSRQCIYLCRKTRI